MKYFSICSGIESVGVAWNPLGFECLGLSEIDPFRSAVLNYHYPEVKNYGDFTKIQREQISDRPDILVGGTPCATFSIAGLREGISTERGNLALEFIKLAQRLQPTWVVWENVPGVLSSNGGRDFASFLGGLAECGYGFAYRVLNTEYVRTQRFPRAIPQRRRRVFVIGHIRDWRSAGKVLFDSASMPENPEPRRRTRQTTSRKSEKDTTGGNTDQNNYWRKVSKQGSTNHYTYTVIETSTPDKTARIQKDEISPTLTAMTGGNRQPIVFIDKKEEFEELPCEIYRKYDRKGSYKLERETSGTIPAGGRFSPSNSGNALLCVQEESIRRLTPVECERLQGFPDNYTQIPYSGKPKEECPITKRYEAVGRAMSINVMEWLGTRIQKVHQGEI